MVYKLLTDLLLWESYFWTLKELKIHYCCPVPNIGLFYIDVLLLCRFFFPVYICSIAFVTKLILYLCWDFRFSHRIMDTYLYNKALLAIKLDMTCICLPETLFGIKLITKNFRFLTHLLSNYHYF